MVVAAGVFDSDDVAAVPPSTATTEYAARRLMGDLLGRRGYASEKRTEESKEMGRMHCKCILTEVVGEVDGARGIRERFKFLER